MSLNQNQRRYGETEMPKKRHTAADLWLTVQRRGHLTDDEVRMARELGLNPHKLLGNIASTRDEAWKAPTGVWIQEIYARRHRSKPTRRRPDGAAADQSASD